MSNTDPTVPLAANVGPLVCQFCRRRWPNRLDANCCAAAHPRGTRTHRFLACSGCSERVFVGHRCEQCGTLCTNPGGTT